MTLPHSHTSLSRRHFLLASASVAVVTACATPVTGEDKPSFAPSTDIRDLLAAEAVTINSFALEDSGISALAARLAGAQMIGLGEATHGSHEDALLKSLLIQSLVQDHDLRIVLLEANRTGTAQLDAYASAAPTGLLAADAVRQAPVFSILKTEVMADLLSWLRGWNAVNADRPVRVIGVDCQASSQDAADALAALAVVNSGAAEALSGALEPILTAEARGRRHSVMLKQLTSAQLNAAETACRMLEAELNSAGLPDAAFTARRAWQGLNAFEYETSDGDLTRATPEYWSRRDVFMAENAITLSKGQPAVFWGHNSHVAGGRPGGDSAGYVPSGAVLRDRLGAGYKVVIQDFAEAEFFATPAGDPPPADAQPVRVKRTARPGTLNALLASASIRTAWFDLSRLPQDARMADWRETPIGLDWYGFAASAEPLPHDILNVPPQGLFDVLVIHPKLTPSRML